MIIIKQYSKILNELFFFTLFLRFLLSTTQHDDELALGLVLLEMCYHLGQRTAHTFLVNL